MKAKTVKQSEHLIEVKGLQKSYRKGKLKTPILKGIHLNINRGESVAIIGASGAGKSTLLHIMGALDEPTVGKVYFEGQDIFQMSEDDRCRFRNRHLGFVFQFHHLLPEFTALENVMMPGLIAGRAPGELERTAKDLLAEVGLSHRFSHRPSELSGGESQRVALARALIMRPELLLADEPTGNLDSENGAMMIDLLKTMNRNFAVTLVVVTHDQKMAGIMGRVVEMRDGRIDNEVDEGDLRK
jgi:lipoprotein-releasing system ATP-binding protein